MYVEELFGLKGKVAVVTGASKGIGKTAAVGLAKAGAEVAILCRSEPKEALEGIAAADGRGYWIAADVTDEAAVDAAFAEIARRSGVVHVVFNNAGICIHEDSVDAPAENFRTVMNVNFFGEFFVARAAARIMMERGIRGSIINMASMSGSIVNLPQWQCSYNASKAAVIHMTRSLAVEWVKAGIRVNCISPGYIATGALDEIPEEYRESWIPMIPMARMGKPEELLPALLYLASDASGYTTGSNVIVDGGYTCL
ncbi:SDR family oxidoreductase [Anaerotruncus massiliensis (ex Togo et al. 2019)]|uniref:SDR family oxidoreductase n=1 Tax=Anaerotruncus massiliensis (ex Togo et al. 2019) TaxID=1673720 RepID=UPI0027BA327C|nr:SDR family oxidoreductase [Anaerotruncus massiliensis (ex Togo et al. 2019)]